jgi:hypothetical protein
VYDWALRDWMRLVNPILLPTLDSKVKWKMAADPHHKNPDPHASTNVYWRTV